MGVPRKTTRVPTGTIMAPPAPCATRLNVSMVKSVLTAQKREAIVNTEIARQNILRAPNRSASQLLKGIPMATVTK
ncbi:hypothetical protein StoSoilB13_48740 (plasmid) [Arthrobacter sp. StoSoilB13]|nr:hypothetical protein StoSoilB13_48740 [Arthrobacter sp. StoSoilB13]